MAEEEIGGIGLNLFEGGVASLTADLTAASSLPFEAVATHYFMKRARDSGAPPGPAVYVTWKVTDITTAYPGALPYGGPLVDTMFWKLD